MKALVALIVGIALDFAFAFWMMLCLGWAHACDPRVPNLGFWASFWTMSALGTATAAALAAQKLSKG